MTSERLAGAGLHPSLVNFTKLDFITLSCENRKIHEQFKQGINMIMLRKDLEKFIKQ